MHLLQLLLAVATVLGDTGNIWVRAEPGLTVYLDGVATCVSTEDGGGCMLAGVKVGMHEVKVEMPGGPSSVMQVEVLKEDTTNVNMSVLALRSAAKKGGIELQLAKSEPGCYASIGDRSKPFIDGEAGFYEVVPGLWDVSATCGARTVNGRVNLPPGRIATAEVNLATKSIRVLGDRPRTGQRLVINSSRDKIEAANLPQDAKRALMSSLGSGVTVLSFEVVNTAVTRAIFDAQNESDFSNFMSRLSGADVFQVKILKSKRIAGDHYRMEVELTIPLNRDSR